MTPQETPNNRTPAVLYICAERSEVSKLGTKRAADEGRAFADRHSLWIVDEITDPYGEPIPWKRSGWAQIREMAEDGAMEVAIVRWPNALSPQPALRSPELDYLGRHGVQVRFSWAPLALLAGGGGA
ncbi:hypothetical protein ACIQNI_29200 [Streptomyces sp. NPDC091266]|uniref:hypothetical protein n=1 Tax=Streptomyces sp. NPDC091266 TaxID=3365978 RepID=UPI00382C93F5